MRHQTEPEKQRERNESRKTYHLTKDCQLSISLVMKTHEHRLVYLSHHIAYQ